MTLPADNDRLLADALAESGLDEFRETLLAETLRLARRRRRFRQGRHAAAALVILGVMLSLSWRALAPYRGSPQALGAGYRLVRTQPLSADDIVTTRPFGVERLVASASHAEIVTTTARSGEIHEMNDDELLSLVASRPAALVRLGPDSAELVFVNPEDQGGFPLN